MVRAGLQIAPDDTWLIKQRGDVLDTTGRLEQALAHWECGLALDPEKLGWLQS